MIASLFHYFQQCFTAEELVQIYGLSEESSGMGRSGFAKLSPALVQQILSGSCSKVIEPATSDQLSKTESECDDVFKVKLADFKRAPI